MARSPHVTPRWMKPLAQSVPTRSDAPARPKLWRTILRYTLHVKLGLVFVVLVGLSAFYLRLTAGPVSLQDYAGRVGGALAARIGPGWGVTIADTALELQGFNPAVRANGIEIRNPAGHVVVRAPFGIVSLDPVSLLTGGLSPREIELRDLQVRGTIDRDGTLVFDPGTEVGAVSGPASVAKPAKPALQGASPVSAALASLIEPVVRPTGLIGALDRARVVGARLTLVDADGRERVAFPHLDATFERLPAGDRRVFLAFDGEHGRWTVGGRVGEGRDRRAELEIAGVPLSDLMRFAGSSKASSGLDLKLSGRISAAFKADRLDKLGADFASSAGSIARGPASPIKIDGVTGRAEWDEAARVLHLSAVELKSEGTDIRLTGELRSDSRGGLELSLNGRNSVLAGLSASDRPIVLGEATSDFVWNDAGLTLRSAALKGDGLDLNLSGALVPAEGGTGLSGRVEAANTDVRRLIRVWPDNFNPDLRAYLAERLGGGTVDRLTLQADLDPADLKAAFSETPISERAMKLDFSASGADLAVVDGLPPLRGLSVQGSAVGGSLSLAARSGRIEMPDGRKLLFSEGSFVQTNARSPGSLAQIGFRVQGGADAIASFFGSPLLREAGLSGIDPASVRGRGDFRVHLPLDPRRIPGLNDLALSVSGTLADVGADRLPGGDKLEGANIALAYEAGALSAKGDGRIGGAPATFELRSARGSPPELSVQLTLDDAARARRALPVAPQLSGPVPVKVVATLGAGAKPPRVDADLARASVDGLVPGWVKPAGKPGHVSFTLGTGETSELRDLAVDAGSVQIRGNVTLGDKGGLERADLPTVRLSPGDDLRVQVDRIPGGGYRISLRGNNGDARPILKWMAGPPGKGTGSGSNSREPADVELDLGLNILTGYNDEAMTGVTGRVVMRGSDPRSVQLSGHFRNALLQAGLAKRDAGAPILSVQAGDAGALLRFLDLYRRMVGGRMAVEARSGEGVQDGRLTIDDFGLKGEPALRRIVSSAQAGPASGGAEERGGIAPIARTDIDQVLFNRLTADFRRTAARVDYRDVVIYGAQIGFNLSGNVDFARDRLDLSGTFVPAYMLNNAFSQVPVVGLLLGGGRNEGLFAVDFRVVGPVAGPTLTVNPLTAVAPGILRKLFGWALNDHGDDPGDAGARRSER